MCLFYKITKLYCPGCGGTRMFFALLHGDIYQAFRYNPLIFIELPILGILFIYQYYCNKNKKKMPKWINIFTIILMIITMLYGIIRNFFIFSFLAPTVV